MKSKLFVLSLAVVAALALWVGARARAQSMPPNYQLVTTIKVPGGLAGFDISWVDPGTQRYYLTDRTATKGTGRIDVVDTQTNTLLYTIPRTKTEIGFSGTVPAVTPGCTISGPNGVVAIPQTNQLYIGDGDSTVKVVDLVAKAVVAVIPTGGKCRADELNYDAKDHIIMITNPAQVEPGGPFITFISTDTQSVLGRYTYPTTQSGLEQTVWNPKNDKFYISVPAITGKNTGSIDQFDPITMQLEKSFPTVCSPAGLVLTPSQHLMTSCGEAFDVTTGTSLGRTMGAAADQLWYNPGDNLFYFGGALVANSATALGSAVLDGNTNQLLTHIQASTHTLAADPNYNKVFIPVTGSGIQVWAAQ